MFWSVLQQVTHTVLILFNIKYALYAGTAAVNINGQTLHSTFGFSFGNEHYSLPDQQRDNKRENIKNLWFLIIDEVSMVKADQVSLVCIN